MINFIKKNLSGIFTSFDLRIVTPITQDAVAIPIKPSRN
jgi:hypothetical protein